MKGIIKSPLHPYPWDNMRRPLRDALIILGWAIILANFILNTIYQGLPLNIWILLSIFLVSAFAGFLLVDADRIVLASLATILLSAVIIFLCLSLPALLGRIGIPQLGAILYAGALGLTVKYLFPFPIALCILGGLVGGMMGERRGMG
jgi:hypothetical protein